MIPNKSKIFFILLITLYTLFINKYVNNYNKLIFSIIVTFLLVYISNIYSNSYEIFYNSGEKSENGDMQNDDKQNGDMQNGDMQNDDMKNGDMQNDDMQNGINKKIFNKIKNSRYMIYDFKKSKYFNDLSEICPKIPNMNKYIKKTKIPCWGCNL